MGGIIYISTMTILNQKEIEILKSRMKKLEEVDTKNMTKEQLKEHMDKIIEIRTMMVRHI